MHPDELYSRIEKNLEKTNADPATLATLRTDVNTLYEMLTNARREARTDTLTQLPNYTGLTEILEREEADAKRHKKPLTLAFMDFVGLKQYNDTYGHAQANYAIQEVAKTIKNSIRSTDIVARYGGDELCLVLLKATKEKARNPIRRIVHALKHLSIDAVVDNLPDENYKHVAISIGYTQLKPDETYKKALERADQAMYKAKKASKATKRTKFRSA